MTDSVSGSVFRIDVNRSQTLIAGTFILVYTVPADCLYADLSLHGANNTGGTTFLLVSRNTAVNGIFAGTTNLVTGFGATNVFRTLPPGFEVHVRTSSGASGFRVSYSAVEVLSE